MGRVVHDAASFAATRSRREAGSPVERRSGGRHRLAGIRHASRPRPVVPDHLSVSIAALRSRTGTRLCPAIGVLNADAGWPVCWAGRARRPTRCSPAAGSRAGGAHRARATSATSGLSPGRCCTWTSSAWLRVDRPGPWATGRGEQHTTRSAGWVYLHGLSTTTPRSLYVEQHAHEDAEINARTLERAPGGFDSFDDLVYAPQLTCGVR